MNKKYFIILIILFGLKFTSYAQDSIRTRNDKPGTPQSLRTNDNTPRNREHLINSNRTANQSINHEATESNKVNNAKEQTIIADPNTGNGVGTPKTPITIINQPAPAASRTDSIIKNNAISNGKSNATNPIRK